MELSINKRSVFLDLLKGIAIIAVILYHCRLFTFGYLGVEIFLVVGGYLITKSLVRPFNTGGGGKFSYSHYLTKRILRLWTPLIVVTLVSVMIACLVMLPMAIKAVVESAIGTITFTNNIVQFITTGNYWDVNNDVKPLMHTWYIALMMQCYLIYPLVLIADIKFCKKQPGGIVLFFSILSLIVYLIPTFSEPSKFYLLPARFFEFGIGGFIALHARNDNKYAYTMPTLVCVFLALLFINFEISSRQSRLLVVIACLALALEVYEHNREAILTWETKLRRNVIIKMIAQLGAMSYSLYLWHQVVLAFYRYCFTSEFSTIDYILCLILSLIFGWISYKLLEQRVVAWQKKSIANRNAFAIVSTLSAIIIVLTSSTLYHNNGFIREVPELDIYNSQLTENANEYNSINKSRYDHDFSSKNYGQKNVLVVGDSFGRDWINVLRESGCLGKANLSYHTDIDSILWERSRKADIIFLATNTDYTKYSDLLPLWLSKNFYRVGRKYIGETGPVYFELRYGLRGKLPSYKVSSDVSDLANRERNVFGSRYIDVMKALVDNRGNIIIMAPDRKLISQDGLHLTKPGAQFIAAKLKRTIEHSLK